METKKVKMRLDGLNANAFVLLGRFAKEAKRQGWTEEEIKTVVDKAKSGNYDHLLTTLIDHTEDPEQATE